MNNKILLLAFAIPLILFNTSCKDENDEQALNVHFHSAFGTDDFAYNTEYDLNGVKLLFTKAQVYVSDFVVKTNPEQAIEDVVVSINPSKHTLDIGTIPNVGNSAGLKFSIGVDDVVNHTDPSTYPATSPLSSSSSEFEHWSWNSGYRFVVLEGEIDTNGDGTLDDFFEFHLGTDDFYTVIDLNQTGEIIAGQDFTTNVRVDYSMFFDGIDLANDYVTHTNDNINLANAVKDNFSKVFSAM